MNTRRLFIIANRLPICVTSENDEVSIKVASGGLASAISSYLHNGESRFSEVFWAGMPGCSPAVWNEAANHLEGSPYTYLPVMVYKEQYEKYYNGFSNSALWPLFHYFPSFAEYNSDHYENYQFVNGHFADVLFKHLRPGDTVWIHDYHLLPLAQKLRSYKPKLNIGFFLHIPFPSFEIFRLLPGEWQVQLLKGILGADLIGFHTIDYASHFLESVQMVLGVNHDRYILRHDNRLIKVAVHPICIYPDILEYDKYS